MKSVPLIIALIMIASVVVAQTSISGIVTHVRDGDTIVLDTQAVRLNGVHAPERDGPGGPAATDFMRDLVLGMAVTCDLNGKTSYDRVIGICYLDGEDIGRLLIEAGLGRDCPRYSGGRYADAEQPQAHVLTLPGYC